MFEHYLSLGVQSIFIQNMALAFFIGMCPFLSCSKKVDTALGMGAAVILVMALTTPLNCVVYRGLLREGALAWVHPSFKSLDLSFLAFLSSIATIAASVQLVEMIMDRYIPKLYAALGIFLPLITVNCAILAAALFMIERDYTVGESFVFGTGAGIGWALAIAGLAAVREKIRYSNVPPGLRGLGITFISAGLMAIGFMAFSGIQL
jgi:Na+-transporting NADH:ubiquinone oxidoreductase subunit E